MDNGSTDNSVEVIKEYARKHSIIKPVLQPRNRGNVFAAREMVAISEGDHVVPLAANYFFQPKFFELGTGMLAAIRRLPCA